MRRSKSDKLINYVNELDTQNLLSMGKLSLHNVSFYSYFFPFLFAVLSIYSLWRDLDSQV